MKKFKYDLIKSDRRTISLQIKNGEILVRAPKRMKARDIDRFVAEHADWISEHLELDRKRRERLADITPLSEEECQALKRAAEEYFPERVAHYAERMGVDYGRISYRFQRSRWGSCSASGNLSFNCLLMLTSPQIIDAIIVHELAHRKEMNHSKRFYSEVLRVYPDYYVHHGELQRVSSEIMRRNPNSK